MKFLVLACIVVAASASPYTPFPSNSAKAFASVSYNPSPVVPAVVQSVARTVPAVVSVAAKTVPVATVPVVSKVKSVSVNTDDVNSVILKSTSDVNPDGYAYSYETSNGIAANSEGVLKSVDNVPTLNVQGQYQYVSPDGTPVQITYVANEFGYQPNSDILPKAHPIPEAILRSLEYIAAHPQKEEQVYKKYNN